MTRSADDWCAKLTAWTAETVDEHWTAVDAFIDEVGPEKAEATALRWCRSTDDAAHAAGLDVLGTLVRLDPRYTDELFAAAGPAVLHPHEDVRWSAAWAVAGLDDTRTEPLLLAVLDDADSDVRYIAVQGLPRRPGDLPDDHPVVVGLIGATRDPDANVRDWATFNLGQMLNTDTPKVRDALADRLNDDGDSDVAAEAARSLARRYDSRVLDVLLDRLTDPLVDYLYIEAAAELGDARLLPVLRALKASGWGDGSDYVDTAIARCSKG